MKHKNFYTGLGLLEDNSHSSCVLVLLITIGIVLKLSPLWCLYRSFYIQGRSGYNESNRVDYNMIIIRTLSLLTYFIYIHIDIIFYALGSTPSHSELLLRSSESMRGGTTGTNPHQSSLSSSLHPVESHLKGHL
jgi:hypothetical protein